MLLLSPHSKSDMSRLRLAAGGAIMKLAQEPCYHDIITPEQFQLCGLVINVSLNLYVVPLKDALAEDILACDRMGSPGINIIII